MSDQDDAEDPCPPTQPGRRMDFVAVLLGLVGLTAPAEAYLRLVDPAGPPAEQREVAKESDCILVALGAEELFFVCARDKPYVNGSAPRLLEERAGGSPMHPGGAMRLATLARPPGFGDAVWYGAAPGGAPEHVEHVVAVRWLGPATLEIDVVAGGERVLPEEAAELGAAGAETVKKLTRILDWDGHRFVDLKTRRPVIGLVDCEDLAARLGVRSEAA